MTTAARTHRVVHIITRLELGGAQRNTLYTVKHLDPERWETILICGEGGILDEEARSATAYRTLFVPELVREVRPLRDLAALRTLTRLLRELHPDIVHTHSSKAGVLGRIAAWRARVPVVIHTVHGFSFSPFHSPVTRTVYRLAERLVAPLTTRFFCVSRANESQGRRLRLWKEGRSEIVRSGIDIELFSGKDDDPADVRTSLGIPATAPVVGTVGNFKPQKAPLDLIEVFDAVHQRVPAAHFVVVGDGPLRGDVERSIEEKHLGHHVHLLGWRKDIPRLLRGFDVFLLVSLWEGLPRSLLQARASGLPCVATSVDGSSEALEDGVTGYLVPPRQPEEAARRTSELLEDPSLRARMGRAAKKGLEEFSIDTMVERPDEIYTALLRGEAPRRSGSGGASA